MHSVLNSALPSPAVLSSAQVLLQPPALLQEPLLCLELPAQSGLSGFCLSLP